MSDNFDGHRDTRLRPPCICGDILVHDEKENVWFCDECGLDLEPSRMPPTLYDDIEHDMILQESGQVRTDEAPEHPVPVKIIWAPGTFHVRILIEPDHLAQLKSQLGIKTVISKYWYKAL